MSKRDLLSSSKALLDLDADGALVPHGLGGHGRTCLSWCVGEIERLRAALLDIANMPTTHDGERIFGDIARAALEANDE